MGMRGGVRGPSCCSYGERGTRKGRQKKEGNCIRLHDIEENINEQDIRLSE